MDSLIIATIISGVVALIGVIVSVITTRWSIKLNTREIDIKAKELDTTLKKLEAEFEAIRQSQFSETLRKRSEYYPKLWGCIREFTTNWDSDKPKDSRWVKTFLSALNKVDAEGGVFFSEAVYEKFHELQYALYNLEVIHPPAKKISLDDLEKIDRIFRGGNGKIGLATYLKDDLGSYRDISIQARSSNPRMESLSIQREPKSQARTSNSIFYDVQPCPPLGCGGATVDTDRIRDERLKVVRLLSLKPNADTNTVIAKLESQTGFKDTAEKIGNFISVSILKRKDLKISLTESLVSSGLIDDFSAIDLVLFIEDNYGLQLQDLDHGLPFDSLVDIATMIYNHDHEKG